ncbi:MAG: NAD(P)-dependent oxidoreductase, partial [Rhizobiaceae bacterium]|nr:NAD(P)-dependent oxidoreductase [Rhizobiaceae bacterium]
MNPLQNGIHAGRLSNEVFDENFGDLHPPLNPHEAQVEADRCYFCYDAPCMNACPTEIDIPLFIRQISTGNTLGSAKTIFDQNILGGMCARVCPTETLCEEVRVRETAEGKPVKIGELQRFATDIAMKKNATFYVRAPETGKKVAVIGAGPSGLACAHRLATHGHDVTILEAREKSGGLNEYGIAAYKSVDGFAAREVEYVLSIGGITIKHDQKLGENCRLDELANEYDAVFIAAGLGGAYPLFNEGDVDDAIDFISDLRQADDLSKLAIGRHIVVIGGGMTAIDAAIQAKLLGAEEVTLCYRRGKEAMNASEFEQDLATSKGVAIRHWLQPGKLVTEDGKLTAIEMEYTANGGGKLAGTGEMVALKADQIFSAIGQSFMPSIFDGSDHIPELDSGRIKTDDNGKTSLANVWAGGDCI